ncbi:MFS general substrate transporter [Ganoderma leucocontextum]|nr:MFS general substrate transporter [Ganoderma leucocontextum]
MAGLTVPATHQEFAAPGPGSSKADKMYAPYIISSSEGLAEPEEIVSIVVVERLDNGAAAPPVMTKAMRRQKSVQFAALCMALYLAGWNDAMVGPLIPRLREVYHIGYAVVSLVFIVAAVGYIFGASAYVYLTDRFASILVAVGTSIQALAPPFPVFVVARFLVGFATIFLDGGSSAFVASLTGDTSVRLSIMYTAYGVAATCAPLASTQFARLSQWSLVFLVTVGFAITTAILQVLAFKFQSQEDCLKEIGQPPLEITEDSLNGINKYKQVFRLHTVHLMALFLFTHVGIEVTISSWIVTFMVEERHGGPLYSGYISSAFWGGSTIGRLALIPLTQKLGEWRALPFYILLCLGLELVMWLVPSFGVNAVAVVFVGFLFGPIYATVMAYAGRILPPELIGGAISWIAIFTAAGGAVFPYIIGSVASRTGMGSMLPLLMTMEASMLVIWAFVPKQRAKLT